MLSKSASEFVCHTLSDEKDDVCRVDEKDIFENMIFPSSIVQENAYSKTLFSI